MGPSASHTDRSPLSPLVLFYHHHAVLVLYAPPRRLPSLDPRRFHPPRQDGRPAGGRRLLGSRPVDQQLEPAALASSSSFGRRFVAPPALWPVPLRRSAPEHRRQHPRVILLERYRPSFRPLPRHDRNENQSISKV